MNIHPKNNSKKKLILAILIFFFLSPIPLLEAAKPKIQVQLEWEYQNLKGTMQLYEPHPNKQLALWKTASVKKKNQLPVGKKIVGQFLEMKPGEKKRMVLVLENNTDQAQHFFAAPHSMTPPQYSLGIKFKCLCINHAFKIPPHEMWYRVVELRMDRKKSAKPIAIKHVLIGINESIGIDE